MSSPRWGFLQVRVPAGLEFAALKLRRRGDGDTSFDRDVFARVLAESGIPEASANEDVQSGIIAGWYRMHREAGGALDPVMEQLIREGDDVDRHAAN